jgi:hypothetical protein
MNLTESQPIGLKNMQLYGQTTKMKTDFKCVYQVPYVESFNHE